MTAISNQPQLPIKTASAGREIIQNNTSLNQGIKVISEAAMSLYTYYRRPLAYETWNTPLLRTTGDKLDYRVKICRPDGRTGTDSDEVDIWLLVRRQSSYPTYSFAVAAQSSDTGDATSPTELNDGSATSLIWWNLGKMNDYHSTTAEVFDFWIIAYNVGAGIGVSDGVYGVAVLPGGRSTTPVSPGDLANGVAYVHDTMTNNNMPLTPVVLQKLQIMLIKTYQYAVEMIYASAAASRDASAAMWITSKSTSDGLYLYDRFLFTKPWQAQNLTIWANCSLYNAGNFLKIEVHQGPWSLTFDDSTPPVIEATLTHTAGGWLEEVLDISDLSTNQVYEVFIFGDQNGSKESKYSGISAYFDDLSYT